MSIFAWPNRLFDRRKHETFKPFVSIWKKNVANEYKFLYQMYFHKLTNFTKQCTVALWLKQFITNFFNHLQWLSNCSEVNVDLFWPVHWIEIILRRRYLVVQRLMWIHSERYIGLKFIFRRRKRQCTQQVHIHKHIAKIFHNLKKCNHLLITSQHK